MPASLLAGCAGLWMLAAAVTAAQTPAPPAPKKPLIRVIFENERVRVLEVVWEPGAGVAATRLRGDDIGVVGVVIRGGTMEHVQANGKKIRRERQSGDVLWERGNAQIEARQNVGPSHINIIQVRLKNAPPARAYTGPLAGTKKVFDNARVAAFDHTISPGAKSPSHKYGPRVWVVLEGGYLRSLNQEGKPQEALIRTAQVLWLPAQEHGLENIGRTPFRAISLELK